MRPNKLHQLADYCDRFQTITLFELTQYFGSSWFLVFIILSALPLLVFSTQLITVPLSTLCMVCSIWYYFDTNVWLADSWKAKSIASSTVKKCVLALQQVLDRWENCRFSLVQENPSSVHKTVSVALIAMSAFAVGFAASSSFLPVLCLILLPLGLLLQDLSPTFMGYLLFALEVLREVV